MPFFSTIVPVFNRANLISITLDSILSQEFNDQEVIVVDDSSTDNTLEVLERYGDRIKVFQQENKGAGAARNLGIRHARGEYITFLDSDDIWFPWTLATYAQVIRENHSPAFVAGTGFSFWNEAEIQSVCPSPLQAEYFHDYYASANQSLWIGTCAVAIRVQVLRELGGYTEQRINAEDSDLWLKLGTARGFVYVQSPLAFGYRRHANSATADSFKTYLGICYLIQQEKSNQYPGKNSQKHKRIKILTRHIRPVSLACLRQDEIRKGWELYKYSFKWHIQQKRVRYLLGFPLIASLAAFQHLLHLQRTHKTQPLCDR